MTRERLHRLMASLAVLALIGVPNMLAMAQTSVVHAVLFFSPTCGHCHYVITEVLPPLLEHYGDQLQIVGVSTATTGGQMLYQAAIERFSVPDGRRGVPALFLDDTLLVGSNEIPEQFPALIEEYLAAGGVGWPDIPGLAQALESVEPPPEATVEATAESTAEATAEATAESTAEPAAVVPVAPPDNRARDAAAAPFELFTSGESASDDLISKLQRDPAGNALAILLLIGMLAVVGHVARRLWLEGAAKVLRLSDRAGWRDGVVVVFCLVGLGVSVYMAYVEVSHTSAVCGPIGDCNTVQQSPYATLFGVLPIGLLGIAGYAAMLVVWALRQWGHGQLRRLSAAALLAMALFGAAFSIYLTFLEPFVIGATCMWCLTSALSMTLVLFALAGALPEAAKPTNQEALA